MVDRNPSNGGPDKDIELIPTVFGATNDNSDTLTAQDVRDAIEKMHELDTEQNQTAYANALKAASLMEATPEHLRATPFIVALATAIGQGAIFHPEDAKWYQAEWERLCREG